jgi:CheY-like chemotaxis protein
VHTSEPSQPSQSSQRRLLIVDDHEDTRQILVRLLKGAYEVSVARCYDSALAQAAQAPPHVVVSDIGLPGRNGVELMRELRRLYGVAGIAVSGHRPENDEWREAGFVSHLLKPIRFDELLAAVEQACARPAGSASPTHLKLAR